MKRIEKFLTCDEIESNETEKIENGINGVEDKTSRVYDNKEIGWENTTENILEDVSIQAASSQLIAIVGPVGAGKTTLLHVILKEIVSYGR
ncbi:hypothetical protein NQ317_003461 [Molorchus minor]|uniref:ABC transporter domain-containing protein n=1 Tax=Molorchus minor TaxID=1323400 RepID=A0ABQ9JZB2_9CUCU|nr:hypothetical protein NQ317_003461 [Molorchus minor]